MNSITDGRMRSGYFESVQAISAISKRCISSVCNVSVLNGFCGDTTSAVSSHSPSLMTYSASATCPLCIGSNDPKYSIILFFIG